MTLPWQKGISGNPAGRRPRLDSISMAIRAAQLKLSIAMPESGFKLTAHDVLRAVYNDPDAPWEVRLRCAEASLAFEKPRLNATALAIGSSDLASRLQAAQRRVQALKAGEALNVIEGSLCPPEQSEPLQTASAAAVVSEVLEEGGESLRLEDYL